jgi:hypothetical protein
VTASVCGKGVDQAGEIDLEQLEHHEHCTLLLARALLHGDGAFPLRKAQEFFADHRLELRVPELTIFVEQLASERDLVEVLLYQVDRVGRGQVLNARLEFGEV